MLGYTGALDGSAEMNVWLHKQVMTKLAETGGKVPDSLKTKLSARHPGGYRLAVERRWAIISSQAHRLPPVRDDVARNTRFALAAIAQDLRLLRADQHL